MYVVLDSKSHIPVQGDSSPFSSMMKQEPINGLVTSGHLTGYQRCSASDNGLMSPTTPMTLPEKNYLVDDRGLLNGTVYSGPGPGPGGVQHQQLTRVNGLRVNYSNRGGTIRSYHCRLCRKVSAMINNLITFHSPAKGRSKLIGFLCCICCRLDYVTSLSEFTLWFM